MNQRRLISFLKDLVSIESHPSSLEIADYVSGVLEEYGYKTKADSQGNVVSSIGSGLGKLPCGK